MTSQTQESYLKMRKSIVTWCAVTSSLIVVNVGEIVYVTVVDSDMMRVVGKLAMVTKAVQTPFDNLVKMIAIASVHSVFFVSLRLINF